MDSTISWLSDNWKFIVVPVAVFITALIATAWLRNWLARRFIIWLTKFHWDGEAILIRNLKRPSIILAFVLSASLALAVSQVNADIKIIILRSLWTLFMVFFTLSLIFIKNDLLEHYNNKLKLPRMNLIIFKNVLRFFILGIAFSIVMELWGLPTITILIAILIIVVALVFILIDIAPNFLATLQINARGQIKVGDYIKLNTGEEGYVREINWRNTSLKGLNDNLIIIPNNRLIKSTVINYGYPLKKAKEPFRFYSRSTLTEMTGLKASNIKELIAVLKNAPDEIVYYHTHHFIETHQYLTPEPPNDFALWLSNTAGYEFLSEKLASIDTFSFNNIASLKERIIGILEQNIPEDPDIDLGEFHFMKSVSIIYPLPYSAMDMREFIEALRLISQGSLYYHIFESRLRVGKGLNDFTIWLQDSLDEQELGEKIAKLDPYNYTLEGLRSILIQLIEKHIK